jgi:Uma2 family endonuclease
MLYIGLDDTVIAMNIAILRTAEDLPPRRTFTVADVRRMVDAGVIAEDERVELIGGEFFVMAAKGHAHELIKSALVRAVIQMAPPEIKIGIEMTVQFSPDVLLDPDIAVFPQDRLLKSDEGFMSVEHGGCSLIIEVAVSRLSYDKGLKAALYASLGVRELWVIDANERIAWVHTGPHADGWSSIVERGPNEPLTTSALPGFSIRLGDIT